MKKILFSTISIIFLMYTSINADSIKSSKNIKSSDQNKSMTDDEFMKQFMALDKREKKAKEELEASKRTGKTLDEINNLLGVDKK
ncbi:MAG: hypothetical protein PHQ22_09010 [Sulfuricurvum sp.]|nr:hypothetical protein [Sulfuricurvum sp.]